MSTLRLFIDDSNLPLGPLSEVEWRVIDGATCGRGRGLLADAPTARRLEVFLPPSLALRSVVELPPGGRRQAAKLLVHALDTVLLGDPSAQHLAFTVEGDRCRVTAVERSVLESVLAALSDRKLRPHAVYIADALVPSDGQTLLWYGNGWARRLPDAAQWFDATDPSHCPALLSHVLGAVERVQLAVSGELSGVVELTQWQSELGVDVALRQGDPLATPLLPDAVNLLQGEYAAGLHLDIDFQRVKPAIGLAAAALVLLTLGWFGQWLAWRHEEKALAQSMQTAYATAFPREQQLAVEYLKPLLEKKLHSSNAVDAADPVGGLLRVAQQLRAPSGTRLLSLEIKGNRIDAEYLAKPEQILPLVTALGSLGRAETHPSGADHVSLSLALNP